MFAAFIFTVIGAAPLAEAAVVAEFQASALGTFVALFAHPIILLAAEGAVVSAFITPDDAVIAPAAVTFWAMLLIGITAFAEATFRTDFFIAMATFFTMLVIMEDTCFTEIMLVATYVIAIEAVNLYW